MRGFASSPYRAAAAASTSKPSQPLNPIDHRHISQIIQRKDWFLILNQSLTPHRINLNPRLIISLLQNQENPLHSLRVYLWISNTAHAKDQSLKTVLGNALFRKGPLLLSKELLKEVRDSGFSITDELMCVLIGSWGRLGLAKYCNDVFAEISLLGMKPSTRLYNAVIDALVKSNSLDLAYLKFHQMRGDGCEPDRFTYNILVHGVCKKGVVDEAVRLVKQMEREGKYRANVFTYTILVDGFLRAGRVEEALKQFETMRGRRMSPNEATVRTLVHGVFRCLPKCEAFEVLLGFIEKESSLQLQRVGYDTVLCCLSSNSMAKETALFLRKTGYVPDSLTFNAAMNCLLKGYDLVETCGVFDSFVSRGVKPGFNGYLVMVQSLLNAHMFSEGELYLKQMGVEGIISSVYDYNAVIDCLCKARRTERAAMYLKEMQGRGISPSLVTFNTLLSGYSTKGDVKKVQEVVEKLLEHGCKPDVITFSSIINCLCRAKEIKDAFECFTEMLEWGVEPNEITYNILIRSSCSMGDTRRSVKLFAEMKEKGLNPDVYAYNAVIQSFCRMRKVEKGEELFKTMLRIGLKPDNYTYSSLIKALSECGRESEAREMFRSMERHGCVPDSYTKRLVEELDLRMSGLERETVLAS